MEEYLPIWILIVMGLTIGMVGFGYNYNSNKNYENAVTLSSNNHYDVYLDGKNKIKIVLKYHH